MATLTKEYPSESAARRAVEALRVDRVSPRHIRLLTSHRPHDIRREHRGGFAGPVGPDAPVGTYAGPARPRSHAIGSFATGTFTGHPDRRTGSFADVQ